MGKQPDMKPVPDPEDASYHIPVMLTEAVEALQVKPDGVYVDCTFGGGGHSKAILAQLGENGKLIAFDQDEAAAQNVPDDPLVIFIPHNFRHIARFLRLHGFTTVDGILADLGVSSHQFDEADRGFSFRFQADLDMRMDQRQSINAATILNTYSEQQLHKLFEQYGEVTNSKTLAKTIAAARVAQPFKTIEGFRNAVREIVKGNPNKYFAQVFQALRIEVNDELGAVEEMLRQVPSLLRSGGRIAIITFHSLEDRLVKNFFRRGTFDEPDPNPFSMDRTESELEVITRKPVLPTEQEMKMNSRSRSAKLRIAAKR